MFKMPNLPNLSKYLVVLFRKTLLSVGKCTAPKMTPEYVDKM